MIVSAVFLGAMEVTARIHYGSSFEGGRQFSATWKVCGRYDERLGWANRARARGRVETGNFVYRVDINNAGFRDPERDLEKAQGRQRVVLLGDSVSWGWGVNDGERFSDKLDTDLGAKTDVINLAVPGYGTDQHLWSLLDHGLAYDPDVVLLGFVLNDVIEAASDKVYNLQKPRYVKGEVNGAWELINRPVPDERGAFKRWGIQSWRQFVASSAALTWMNGIGRVSGVSDSPTKKAYKGPSKKFLKRLHEQCDKLSDPNSVTFMLLERIQAVCEEQGIPLLIFSVAHMHDQYLYEPEYPTPVIQKPKSFQTYLTRRLREAGRTIGFQTLSVDAAMLRAVSKGERLQCGDGHLNIQGNLVVAGALLPRLRALLRD